MKKLIFVISVYAHWIYDKMNDINQVITLLLRGVLPSNNAISNLLDLGINILASEPNVLRLRLPLSVCGDIHGQFEDMIELFYVGDFVPDTSYLFLGDYVDRGPHSTETFLLLLAFKVRYPSKIWLLRGNHECKDTNIHYTFYKECLAKGLGSEIYAKFNELFEFIPLCAIIDDRFFCVHGGIGPNTTQIDSVATTSRYSDVIDNPILSDLLWSDPLDDSSPDSNSEFIASERGAGYIFNSDATTNFCNSNNVECIFRAHQLSKNGYTISHQSKVYTIWSAPNYMKRNDNLGSILEIDEYGKKNFKIFKESPTNPAVKSAIKSYEILNQYFL